MSFCQTAPDVTAVECSLKPGIPEVIYPGEQIIFKEAMVGSSQMTNIEFGNSPTKTDIYFLADATGSMNGILNSVKANFLKLAAETDKMGDVAYGVGIFRDERELTSGFRNVEPITTSLDKARAALSKFAAKDGLDSPEGNLVALYQIATQPKNIGWRDGARRVILFIGDNPGHEPSCVKGIEGAVTRERVIMLLNGANIAVISLTFSTPGLDGVPSLFGCRTGAAAKGGQGTAIAKATGGRIIKGYDSTFNVADVVGAIKMLTKEVSVVQNSCKGFVDIEFGRKLPTFLEFGSSVEATLKPMQSICKLGKYYMCQLVFKESGVVLPKLVIKFNLLKCPTA